jgi:hypothetical protein
MAKRNIIAQDESHYHDLRYSNGDSLVYNDVNNSSKCISQLYTGKKKSWTNEEDAYLIKLVQKYGAQKWTTIAENLPGN